MHGMTGAVRGGILGHLHLRTVIIVDTEREFRRESVPITEAPGDGTETAVHVTRTQNVTGITTTHAAGTIPRADRTRVIGVLALRLLLLLRVWECRLEVNPHK